MKLLFSESLCDYQNYIFSYAIWAIPENGETPKIIFANGFLPSNPDLTHFYLCRSIRVNTDEFNPSSENRRILRKFSSISCALINRADFKLTDELKKLCSSYAEKKFGDKIMPEDRISKIFSSALVNNLLVFSDSETNLPVGIVTVLLDSNEMAFYHFSFYDLNYKNLGIYMMTRSLEFFKSSGIKKVYLGTCYSQSALYKTQFSGIEFFNGFIWSSNLNELKYLINKDNSGVAEHLLEQKDYRSSFYPQDIKDLAFLLPACIRHN